MSAVFYWDASDAVSSSASAGAASAVQPAVLTASGVADLPASSASSASVTAQGPGPGPGTTAIAAAGSAAAVDSAAAGGSVREIQTKMALCERVLDVYKLIALEKWSVGWQNEALFLPRVLAGCVQTQGGSLRSDVGANACHTS